jgi:hypothetical protein
MELKGGLSFLQEKCEVLTEENNKALINQTGSVLFEGLVREKER